MVHEPMLKSMREGMSLHTCSVCQVMLQLAHAHQSNHRISSCSLVTLKVSWQDAGCTDPLFAVQELEQMGRVDDIPVHTEASAISQVADSDRYGVHSWSARCADN
jgi:hypothetical protein